MARNNYLVSAFVSGEVSPKFLGRTDTQQYNQACEEIRNMIVYPQGGVGRRPGTMFKKRILQSDAVSNPGQVRIIPFIGTDGSHWQLIITDEKPYNVDAPITPGAAPAIDPDVSAWKAVNIDTGEVSALSYATLTGIEYIDDYYDLEDREVILNEIQFAQSSDTMFLAHGKMRPIRITYDATGTIYGSKFYFKSAPYATGANPGATTTADWWEQQPYQIKGGAFSDEIVSQVILDEDIVGDSPDGGVNNLLATFTFLNAGVELDETWIGRVIKASTGGNTIVVQVYQILSTTTANVTKIAGTMAADPTTYSAAKLEFSVWDDKHGWPNSVGFFEERLMFGGTDWFPDEIWFSETGNVEFFITRLLEQDAGFADPVVATDPFSQTLSESIISKIKWVQPGKTIKVGTNRGEFIVTGPDGTQSIGPTNTGSNGETPHGSTYLQPIDFENTVIFIQRNRRFLREMVFNLGEQSFISPNLNILGEHIANKFGLEREDDDYEFAKTPGAFVAMAKHEVPYGIIWALDSNGCLCGLTRERTQNVAAWHTHELAGDSECETDVIWKPKVESISTIQKLALDDIGTGGEPDELWMIVSRGINGSETAMYLEKLVNDWEKGSVNKGWDFDSDSAPVYMDCAVLYSSLSGSSGVISVAHLSQGDEVTVIMDGYDYGEFTVSAGKTIDISAKLDASRIAGLVAWKAIIGFNYLGRLLPVTPEVPATLGSSMGNIRRVDRITAQFNRSLGCRIGRYNDAYQENTPIDDPDEISFDAPAGSDPQDPSPLFTGDKQVLFPQGYERKPKIMIESFRPYPCQVSCIVARMTVDE